MASCYFAVMVVCCVKMRFVPFIVQERRMIVDAVARKLDLIWYQELARAFVDNARRCFHRFWRRSRYLTKRAGGRHYVLARATVSAS